MSFTPDNVRDRLRVQPFVPLRIVTTTDQTYDIYHPDMVMVGIRFVMVGTPSTENPAYADLFARVAIMHITEMRDLPRLATFNGN